MREVFALRAKDSTPFHSEEPNGLTLPSAREEMQSKLVRNSPRGLCWTSFDRIFAGNHLTYNSLLTHTAPNVVVIHTL
jgi:hypothetical protein